MKPWRTPSGPQAFLAISAKFLSSMPRSERRLFSPRVSKKNVSRALIAALHHGQRHVNVHHIHAEAADEGSGFLVEDVREPARGKDGQTMTVCDVVEGRQLMFHRVADIRRRGSCLVPTTMPTSDWHEPRSHQAYSRLQAHISQRSSAPLPECAAACPSTDSC